MKKKISVRILTALGGAVLLALCVCWAAEGFFGVPVTCRVGEMLASRSVPAVLAKILGTLALAGLAGAALCCALPARRQKPSGYVLQRSQKDTFGITIKSIEKDVLTCVHKHREIVDADVSVREGRSGLVILVDVDQVGGVDIPLFVGRLQDQVRQYVQKRTGMEVSEVRVMVDCRTETEVESEFAVADDVMIAAPAHAEEFHQESAVETPVEQLRQLAEIAQHVQPEIEPEEPETELPAEPVQDLAEALEELDAQLQVDDMAELFEEGEKSMHQRVFGAEELPVIVPMPPEMEAEAQSAEADEAEAAEAESAVETADEAPVEMADEAVSADAADEAVPAEVPAEEPAEAAAAETAEEETEPLL